ncbi:hypothetical protein LJR098_001969 [Rhizobium sp. LjRoot98]|uniref:hypothetical protein n=1 Tax=Rhizobium sp. LjRoot98 TaxID=3342345 RepID=UPI003ECEBA43
MRRSTYAPDAVLAAHLPILVPIWSITAGLWAHPYAGGFRFGDAGVHRPARTLRHGPPRFREPPDQQFFMLSGLILQAFGPAASGSHGKAGKCHFGTSIRLEHREKRKTAAQAGIAGGQQIKKTCRKAGNQHY